MEPFELEKVLESKIFFLQPPFEQIKYQFKNGIIYKDEKALCRYRLSKSHNGNFIMTYSNQSEIASKKIISYTFVFGFDNVLIVIDDDPRFPVIVNSESPQKNGLFTILKSDS